MPLLVYRCCNLALPLKIMGDATRGEEGIALALKTLRVIVDERIWLGDYGSPPRDKAR